MSQQAIMIRQSVSTQTTQPESLVLDWHSAQKLKIAIQREQGLKHEKKESDQWKKWH